MIDHRQWDQHQHSTQILPDGSIAVGEWELLDLKARIRQAQDVQEPIVEEGICCTELVR